MISNFNQFNNKIKQTNESKIGNKLIEIYEEIVSCLGNSNLQDVDSISQEQIDMAADECLSEEDFFLYDSSKDTIKSMLEDEFLIEIE